MDESGERLRAEIPCTMRIPFSAVVFDMDGLMFDTEPMARRAWELALAESGHALDESVFFRMVGRTRPAVREILLGAYGPDLPIDALSVRVRSLLEEAFERQGVPIKPGLLELLDALESARIPVAVASSTFRDVVFDRLRRAGLSSRFRAVVGGDEVSRGKPAPDLFLEACRRLVVPPGECVVLEDSEPGIRGAHAAGAVPIMVPDLVPPSDEVRAMAHRVFPSLLDVLTFLGL
ncbi:MAG TPA: HAD family phosphatase [Deltaproteobacteria bacterium]|nr:HAD family phosphatase [Deltaproteobacteria bacterium]